MAHPTHRRTRLMTAGAVVAATAGVMLTYPGGILAAYRDARDIHELRARLAEDEEVRARCDERKAALADRIAVKDALTAQLVAGRARLAAVAARFRQLNDQFPPCNHVLRARYPGLPEDERAARNVLEYASLSDVPADRRRQVLARLADEYRTAYGSEPPPVR